MPEYRLDTVGDVCPVPLLRVQKEARRLGPGDLLVVDIGQPRTVRNILDWAAKNGYATEVAPEDHGTWRLGLRLGGTGVAMDVGKAGR
ncbi:MAG: sulfurtransferase TusA family protein [Bacillota bacterium]